MSTQLVIIFALCSGYVVFGASLPTVRLLQPEREQGRIFWSQLGDFLENSSFLPITINVPDLIYGLGDLIGGAFSYVFGSSKDDDPSVPRTLARFMTESTILQRTTIIGSVHVLLTPLLL